MNAVIEAPFEDASEYADAANRVGIERVLV
jgi:hypothetical protein